VSPGRPGVLRIGDRIRFAGAAHTVVGLSGNLVRLADGQGRASVVQLPHLLCDASFEPAAGQGPSPLADAGLLNTLPGEAAGQAEWWQRHIVEVVTGLPPGAPAGARPVPQYDPVTRTLTEREQAKTAELTELTGVKVSEHTVRRKRRRYQARGVAGVVDWRAAPQRPDRGRCDPRVLEALEQAIGEAADRSTRTTGYFYWRVQQILAGQHGPGVVPVPSRSAFYRLFARLSKGQHTTGSARTRRSVANRPGTPFGTVTACRPGELVQIDSTPLDVMVLLDDGVPGRVELTGIVDLATRTITAAVLRPTTKSVDASLLLARTVTPEPMRPGWPDALAMSRSVLPHRRLLALDQRLEHAAARPVIVPETIVCDQGKVFVSDNFRTACASLGISWQPAHPGTPTDKPHIERTLGSVASLFAQYVAGYLGRSVEHRGKEADTEPLWPLAGLQDLLDEWIVAVWQNRPHDGLRDPVTPGRAFTPNEKYAALTESAGYVPVALSAEDYVELLPATWRVINAYGIKISHRAYDSEELNPFRRQPSGVKARKDLWEIRHDPYDISRIWVRNHWDGGWITVFWRHLRSVPAPFGEMAWDHARKNLRDEGRQATEREIAEAAAALLDTASRGPASAGAPSSRKTTGRSRRVAARVKAAGQPAWPRPGPAAPPGTSGTGQGLGEPEPAPGEALTDVVPLGVFDAREEARKWW
jgi:putative transposase